MTTPTICLQPTRPSYLDPRTTGGQVIELLELGQLSQATELGPQRLGEIQAGLVLAGFVISDRAP